MIVIKRIYMCRDLWYHVWPNVACKWSRSVGWPFTLNGSPHKCCCESSGPKSKVCRNAYVGRHRAIGNSIQTLRMKGQVFSIVRVCAASGRIMYPAVTLVLSHICPCSGTERAQPFALPTFHDCFCQPPGHRRGRRCFHGQPPKPADRHSGRAELFVASAAKPPRGFFDAPKEELGGVPHADAPPPTLTTRGICRVSAGGQSKSSGTDRSLIGSAATSVDGCDETLGTVVEAGRVPCCTQCGVIGSPGIGVKAENRTCRVSGEHHPVFCDLCLRCVRAKRQLCGKGDQRKALASLRVAQPEKWKSMVRS